MRVGARVAILVLLEYLYRLQIQKFLEFLQESLSGIPLRNP
jgi:hypothetical protein